jgi:hypothetical protein
MRRVKKQQIGARVKPDIFESLDRLAAANNCSVSHYCEGVLSDHIARQQHPDAGGGAFQELLHEIDRRIAAQIQRLQMGANRELDGAVIRIEKQFNVLKAMVDAMAQTLAPEKFNAYVKTVDTIRQRMTLVPENNGGRQ